MQKVGVPLLVCLVAIAAGPGRAQDATSPAPGPTIRVTTTEVALDLIVRDKKGRQVKNLKPGDVEIFEDGVRQQVLSFRMVPGRLIGNRLAIRCGPQTAGQLSLPVGCKR